MKTVCLLLAIISIAPVPVSLGATWSVAKDGSGDFSVIQDALDAAASGDTVTIGPGEYTELTPSFIPGYAWDVEVGMYVRVDEVTILGAGRGQTIVGPSTYLGDRVLDSPRALVWRVGGSLNVKGITFRNCYMGMSVEADTVDVTECRFEDNHIGVFWSTNSAGGQVVDTEFDCSIGGDPLGIWMRPDGNSKTVARCSFTNVWNDVTGVTSVEFVGCTVSGTQAGGLQFTAGASGSVHNCIIDGVYGLLVLSGASCVVDSCEISGAGAAAVTAQGPGSTLEINSSILRGYGTTVVGLQNSYEVTIQNSHILRGEGFDHAVWVIHTLSSHAVIHDFRNNYWGTTDSDSISSWILDGADDPSTFATVTYEPFFSGPVPNEKKSLGSFKAMFRDASR